MIPIKDKYKNYVFVFVVDLPILKYILILSLDLQQTSLYMPIYIIMMICM